VNCQIAAVVFALWQPDTACFHFARARLGLFDAPFKFFDPSTERFVAAATCCRIVSAISSAELLQIIARPSLAFTSSPGLFALLQRFFKSFAVRKQQALAELGIVPIGIPGGGYDLDALALFAG
jgi:hypothetical protein